MKIYKYEKTFSVDYGKTLNLVFFLYLYIFILLHSNCYKKVVHRKYRSFVSLVILQNIEILDDQKNMKLSVAICTLSQIWNTFSLSRFCTFNPYNEKTK